VRVLSVIPASPTLPDAIWKQTMRCAAAMRGTIFIDERKAPECEMKTPWSRVALVRNQILDDGLWEQFTHLLWIDADIVSFPPTLADDLLASEPEGVAAPLVLIEGTRMFYDWAAFIYAGKDTVQPTSRERLRGRNMKVDPPHLPKGVSAMDCVGAVTLVNTDIYRAGARYEDHPAFTDHYPICKKCRDMGRRVAINRSVEVFHAALPKYGLEWR